METRGFDAATGKTFLLRFVYLIKKKKKKNMVYLCTISRSKEDTPDYRFMPDPDLPPLHISEVFFSLFYFFFIFFHLFSYFFSQQLGKNC